MSFDESAFMQYVPQKGHTLKFDSGSLEQWNPCSYCRWGSRDERETPYLLLQDSTNTTAFALITCLHKVCPILSLLTLNQIFTILKSLSFSHPACSFVTHWHCIGIRISAKAPDDATSYSTWTLPKGHMATHANKKPTVVSWVSSPENLKLIFPSMSPNCGDTPGSLSKKWKRKK